MKICSKCKKEPALKKKDSNLYYSYCSGCNKDLAKIWQQNNKDRFNKKVKEYRKKNAIKLNKKTKEHRKNNLDKVLETERKCRKKLRQKRIKYNREYRKKNAEAISQYKKDKMKNDLQYRLAQTLRARLRTMLRKGNVKNVSAQEHIDFLGCTAKECIDYLAELFTDDMSWGNHGDWHIDHIKPLSSFDLTIEGERKKACHYTNLQPLWAEENLVKGAKI